MLRSKIEKLTGLTRKSIEYYEEKGLIKPLKLENGYRDYSSTDLELLKKISVYRKLGLNINDIRKIINKELYSYSIFREKQINLDVENKRLNILKKLLDGENFELISIDLHNIEREEMVYEKLERLFPGYFGQLLFSAYKPFLNDKLMDDKKEYFEEFVSFLDNLPDFKLTGAEVDFIEKTMENVDNSFLDDINCKKIEAVENADSWLLENRKYIKDYEMFKTSDEYNSGLLKSIEEKLKNYMIENKYYDIAIPLIRKFSNSYDDYYKKLIIANEKYKNILKIDRQN